jgi:hypothetical protein
MAYDMTATAAQKAIDALKTYGPQIGAVSTLTGNAGAIFNAMAGATDAAAAGLDNVSTQASKTQQSLGLMSAELSDAIMAFYSLQMPGRDVAGGETIEQWAARVKIYEDSLRGIVPTVEDATTATSGLSDATTTLTNDQKKALAASTRLGDALSAIGDARDSFVSGVKSAGLSYGSLFQAFDLSGGATKASALADAIKAQADAAATLASIGPGNMDARAKAQQDLADATANVATARAESDAAQTTSPNILASYKGRLVKLRQFGRVMASLAKKGLAPLIYQDILNQGVDGGLEMANAIDGGDKSLIGQFNKTAGAIMTATSDNANLGGHFLFDRQISKARKDYGPAYRAAPSSDRGQQLVVNVTMDSKQVAQALLRLKRERGGAKLGIS